MNKLGVVLGVIFLFTFCVFVNSGFAQEGLSTYEINSANTEELATYNENTDPNFTVGTSLIGDPEGLVTYTEDPSPTPTSEDLTDSPIQTPEGLATWPYNENTDPNLTTVVPVSENVEGLATYTESTDPNFTATAAVSENVEGLATYTESTDPNFTAVVTVSESVSGLATLQKCTGSNCTVVEPVTANTEESATAVIQPNRAMQIGTGITENSNSVQVRIK
ncbi:MAG: hypothetical protein WC335_02460 [Candidatus Omnitrophota bacterium]|jgi:uncharacterized protein YoxC